MSGGDEPDVDEAAFQAVQRRIKLTALRPTPIDGDSCATCHYYLEPGAAFAFCWQEKFQVLVGAQWWCQHWELAGS
jgi:hypothetical protein